MISIKKMIVGAMLLSTLPVGAAFAKEVTGELQASLSFSDNRKSVTDLNQINEVLHTVGVHLSHVAIPGEAKEILKGSSQNKLNEQQQDKILKIFALNREQVLDQIKLATRKPVMTDGGSLSTNEVGVPPYPKIYDLKAMSAQDKINAQLKFGKLHVNYASPDVGVDEVMTLVSGGSWTWFFTLKDNVVVKLSMSKVDPQNGQGWRISYPGKVAHGAFMDADDGICVAYITGPKTWLMRYEATGIENAKVLGTNPWIEFNSKQPKLL